MMLKRTVQCVFLVFAVPRLLSYFVARRILGTRAFSAASESIARVPGFRGVYLRQVFYRCVLDSCDLDAYFGWNSVFSMTEARVGERAYVGRFCSIGYADIGAQAMLADGVQVLSGGSEHDTQSSDVAIHDQGQTYRQVRIGEGAWIGAGAVIMADVGRHSIIGAGAVVTQPIPEYVVAVGVPARVIKYRRSDQATF
ncbi:acyltransferase [Allorhodopirellula solitaria]|uniref:Serine acetyltransferase n=1 Tax=Allorhodopirellula solitaria TaxID=2527987 RepID=A0A5C5WMR4_9BACT|nr:acyltransferase [Allorhodopirellula solitaria]TWT51910.1 Serine acetyltransferase [Allorhodopirellula solitaria]